MFEEFWPTALQDPKTSPEDRQIAQTIDDIEKIVFSKSLDNVTWNNSKLFHEINPEEIKELKEQEGGPMAIFGSGTIVQQMANLNLIDEYRILLNPVILGNGKSLFENVNKTMLNLENVRQFKNGNVLLYYSSKK
jgi:dihydrofolate reductase